jgi:hypothetical protein
MACHRHRPVEGFEIRRGPMDGRDVRVDGCKVAAGDGSGQLEAVVDRTPHQRQQRLRRRAGALEQTRGSAKERDEEVRRHGRAGVIQDT